MEKELSSLVKEASSPEPASPNFLKRALPFLLAARILDGGAVNNHIALYKPLQIGGRVATPLKISGRQPLQIAGRVPKTLQIDGRVPQAKLEQIVEHFYHAPNELKVLEKLVSKPKSLGIVLKPTHKPGERVSLRHDFYNHGLAQKTHFGPRRVKSKTTLPPRIATGKVSKIHRPITAAEIRALNTDLILVKQPTSLMSQMKRKPISHINLKRDFHSVKRKKRYTIQDLNKVNVVSKGLGLTLKEQQAMRQDLSVVSSKQDIIVYKRLKVIELLSKGYPGLNRKHAKNTLRHRTPKRFTAVVSNILEKAIENFIELLRFKNSPKAIQLLNSPTKLKKLLEIDSKLPQKEYLKKADTALSNLAKMARDLKLEDHPKTQAVSLISLISFTYLSKYLIKYLKPI